MHRLGELALGAGEVADLTGVDDTDGDGGLMAGGYQQALATSRGLADQVGAGRAAQDLEQRTQTRLCVGNASGKTRNRP